jgi:predicted O-methyltransferase YrrM
MTLEQGAEVFRVITTNRYQAALELGFWHGVSTCYLAGAMHELGGGHVTTIDLEEARREEPAIETVLDRVGLRSYVTIHYEPTSYVWRLMKLLEADPSPRFDFCYLDGAHDWFTDGFAFLLVDRLLLPGGTIIFDDMDWTFAKSPTLHGTPRVRTMPEDERSTPHIRKIWDLLVRTHPGYGELMVRDGWGYARKLATTPGAAPLRSETVVVQKEIGLGAAVLKLARRLRDRIGVR